MINQLMTSNGMYLLIMILCVAGGYHVSKLKLARRKTRKRKAKEEAAEKQKQQSEAYLEEIRNMLKGENSPEEKGSEKG